MLSHERFEAYQISIKFMKIAIELAEQIPSGNSALRDQLRRASTSIVLNIAEGTGKFQPADRRRFYGIARGSATECAAICDIIVLIDSKVYEKTEEAKLYLRSIIAILTKVCAESIKKIFPCKPSLEEQEVVMGNMKINNKKKNALQCQPS